MESGKTVSLSDGNMGGIEHGHRDSLDDWWSTVLVLELVRYFDSNWLERSQR